MGNKKFDLSVERPNEGDFVNVLGNLGTYYELEYLGSGEEGCYSFYDHENDTEYLSDEHGFTHWILCD